MVMVGLAWFGISPLRKTTRFLDPCNLKPLSWQQYSDSGRGNEQPLPVFAAANISVLLALGLLTNPDTSGSADTSLSMRS